MCLWNNLPENLRTINYNTTTFKLLCENYHKLHAFFIRTNSFWLSLGLFLMFPIHLLTEILAKYQPGCSYKVCSYKEKKCVLNQFNAEQPDVLCLLLSSMYFSSIFWTALPLLESAPPAGQNKQFRNTVGKYIFCFVAPLLISSYVRPVGSGGGGGGVGGAREAHATPQEPKRSAWWDHKSLKIMQNNLVMVGLTISVHFQQFEDIKFIFFSEGAYPRTPKTLAECPTVPIYAELSWFYLRIPILKISSHKSTSREIYFVKSS